MWPVSSQMKPEPLPAATSCSSPRKSTRTRVWVTKTVLGATARKTEIVFRSSSVRAPELSEAGVGGAGEGSCDSAVGLGDGGGDVDRHARTAENPKSAEKVRLLERTLRPGIVPSVSMRRIHRVSGEF